ncbi:MAG: sulfotransferase family 2 domain-containing protein [Planctomycetota bacterium]
MLVSYRHEFAYVQIPGADAPSLADSLSSFCEQSSVENWHHRALRSFGFRGENELRGLKQQLSPRLFSSLFKFTIVRNPWDLLVATFRDIQSDSRNRWHRHVGQRSFREFVEFASHNRICSQLERVSGCDGELLVDFVGRYESLDADCLELQRRLGIVFAGGRRPGSESGRRAEDDYRTHYDEELVARVSRLYSRDIDAFGYSFEPDIEVKSTQRRRAA